ncbi:hypothetical protein [Nocardioides bruguierae]|uniref:hypothetical protein n=1 Tax=Nocardioides bruguierae TaxID=2945102 RepID=UPI0020218BF8|nr:hypothetical protein [Nocardioides bruguierae]MCL8027229.1 hypothetical protein [Nocardioides bruguierae]
MDDHTDENVLRPPFGGRRPAPPARPVEVPGHVLAGGRIEHEAERLARVTYRERVRAWVADPDAEAAAPSLADLRREAAAELRVLADALGPWAAPEHDPFEVLGDPEWPRDEGDAGFSF